MEYVKQEGGFWKMILTQSLKRSPIPAGKGDTREPELRVSSLRVLSCRDEKAGHQLKI